MLQVKRVYEKPGHKDGTRILVDRLWPRGLKKEEAAVDIWLKEAAPDTELRHWFAHDPAKWEGFKKRYFRELDKNAGAIEQILTAEKKGTVTLLFGARDEIHNNAVALKDYIELKLVKV